jgi:hypothetical protein
MKLIRFWTPTQPVLILTPLAPAPSARCPEGHPFFLMPAESPTRFYAAALILLTALTIVAGNVSAAMFPIVVAGAFAGLTIIGAFQLRNDGRLSEEAFFKLIDLSMRRVLLPFSKAKT